MTSVSPTVSSPSAQWMVSIGEWWLNAKQPRGLRDCPVWIGEGHRPVVAEHDVERRVGEWHRLGAAMDEREVNAGLGHQASGVLELTLGEVDAHRPRRGLRQGDRPLRSAAPEL